MRGKGCDVYDMGWLGICVGNFCLQCSPNTYGTHLLTAVDCTHSNNSNCNSDSNCKILSNHWPRPPGHPIQRGIRFFYPLLSLWKRNRTWDGGMTALQLMDACFSVPTRWCICNIRFRIVTETVKESSDFKNK